MNVRSLSILAAALLLVTILLAWVAPAGNAGAGDLQKSKSFDGLFTGDEITKAIRDPGKEIVRVEISSPAELDRLEQYGRIIQNFRTYAVIVRDRRSRRTLGERLLDPVISLPGGRVKIFADGNRVVPPKDDLSNDSRGYYIVQFGGIATDEWLDGLRSIGLEILQYVPNEAFLVYGDATAIERAREHSRVRWIGEFRPEQKVPMTLRDQIRSALGGSPLNDGISPIDMDERGMAVFDVAIFGRADIDAAVSEIVEGYQGEDASVIRLPNNFFNVIRVRLPARLVESIVQIPDVIRIDAHGQPQIEDERAAQIVAGNYSSTTVINAPGYDPLFQFGVDGTNVTVSVVDDGVSIPGNGGFYITALNTSNGPLRGAAAGATGGHGHLNASIISGSTPFGTLDPLSYNYGLGIAPRSNILNIPMLVGGYSGTESNAADDTVVSAGVNGVRGSISNNSWGNGLNSNTYDSYTASFDGFVRDASSAGTIDPLLLVFSAGNSGPGALTLTRPKAAKNLIAVGNTENIRTEFGGTNANNMDDLRSSSSRGPTADGRIKPDVTAPGTYIAGSRAGNCSSVTSCFDANHAYSIGTSHAAPQVAGAAALFTQFWKNGNFGQNPSPALVKAAIINTGQEMNGLTTGTATIPNGIEGWGRLNMKNMFAAPLSVLYVDQSVNFSNVGELVTFNGTVADTSKPVRFTLVWTDPPAVGDPALVNNLDLTVSVGANTYRGNVFSGGVSATGGSNSTIDNVENVFLAAGTVAGTTAAITVRATALNGDGILGNADATDQHFALVLYNFALTPTAAAADIAGRVIDSTGNGVTRTSISLADERGVAIATVVSNPFGYFRFADIPTGQTYVLTPIHARYSFSPQNLVYRHFDQSADLIFTASEQ